MHFVFCIFQPYFANISLLVTNAPLLTHNSLWYVAAELQFGRKRGFGNISDKHASSFCILYFHFVFSFCILPFRLGFGNIPDIPDISDISDISGISPISQIPLPSQKKLASSEKVKANHCWAFFVVNSWQLQKYGIADWLQKKYEKVFIAC